ncbi:PAS domain S-box protein [Haloglomus litoreum]|uniref:PAS domain S-box protein n=1 Tax=Haloglomus litoreum TaxID=3034026 RepID=UPI0023E7FF98|nr:PAS domain S-box protein [Haloglomus sp. DT116]
MSSSGSSEGIYVETLAVFDQSDDPCEPLTTPEVADALDVGRRTVYKRLEKLVGRGDLETKKAGANARVWWRASEGPSECGRASEREPERSEAGPTVDAVLERITDGFYGLDDQFRFTYLNTRAADLLDLDAPAVLGRDIHTELDLTDEFETAIHEAHGTQEPVSLEDYYDPLDAWFENSIYPSETGLSVYFRDVSTRKRRQQELEEYRTIVETVGDGIVAVDGDGHFSMVNDAYAELLGYSPAELIGTHASRVASSDHFLEGEELKAGLNAVGDVAQHEIVLETKDGGTIPVEVRFGLFPSDEDDDRGVVAVVRDITERKRFEEELAALNRLNQVFQDVTGAVIESSSREEVERTITTHLTNSDSYEYAWIGHLDRYGKTIVPHITGPDEARLSNVVLSTETDDPTSHGPVAEAVRTGEVQVTYDSPADPVFDKWRQSREIHHRVGISIPITCEERVYGVLNVYTARENAFDESERRIIGRLGEIAGHAISSINRKRALLEDRVTEVTFRSAGIADAYLDVIGHDSFTISIERSVGLTDGQTLTYYSIAGIAPEVFIDVTEDFYPDSECHVIPGTGSKSRVEVKTSQRAGASQLAKYDSRIVGGTFENGEFRFTVGVPSTTDVREVIDLVEDVYPRTEVVSQTEVVREKPRLNDVFSDLDEQLTERQRTALEVAYYSGYFDWPRAITGEELAERLDVTQGTVSHHIRHGERKLVSAFFDSTG